MTKSIHKRSTAGVTHSRPRIQKVISRKVSSDSMTLLLSTFHPFMTSKSPLAPSYLSNKPPHLRAKITPEIKAPKDVVQDIKQEGSWVSSIHPWLSHPSPRDPSQATPVSFKKPGTGKLVPDRPLYAPSVFAMPLRQTMREPVPDEKGRSGR